MKPDGLIVKCIVVDNGPVDASSNPEQECSHFTSQ